MVYKFIITPDLRSQLDKLGHKDKALAVAVGKKITQIISCDESEINHFKNLRGDLSDHKRVHVGSFVLFFRIEGDVIIFDRFEHHDNAY